MGQATVDLPDPLSSAPVSSASTDDLLAQLAGEEIERLLADADEPSAAAPPSVTDRKPGPPIPSIRQPALSSDASSLHSLLEPPTSGVDPAPAAEADLKNLFSQIDQTTPEVPKPLTPAGGRKDNSLDSAPSAADALAEEMLEVAACSPSGPIEQAGATRPLSELRASHDPSATPRHEADGGRIPIYLRVLSWVSSPLDAYPDHFRDLVGKIAILTTVNAAAVLAYVIIFRSH